MPNDRRLTAEERLKGSTSLWAAGEKRRREFMEAMTNGATISDACKIVGVQYETYRKWRERIPGFREKVDSVRLIPNAEEGDAYTARTWTDGFAAFRQRFFGMSSPAFHLEAINLYEELEAGCIGMILFPPEFGKTTLFEDYASMKLATTPAHRFAVGSETKDISEKILGRVMQRMETQGESKDYVKRFGPFTPQKDDGFHRDQPWSVDRFRVWRGMHTDERDFSMAAYGLKSGILSTRTDHFHIDDVQSVNNLGSTDRIYSRVRQDWFSRAGSFGKVIINGSRVGEDDIYERFEQDEDLIAAGILRIVKFTAIRNVVNPDGSITQESLWPEKFPLHVLDRLRLKNGQEAWDRNFMMNPGASDKQKRTFQDEHIERCTVEGLRFTSTGQPATSDGNRWAVITLDPAIGSKNCLMSMEFGPKLRILNIREATGLRNNEDIMQQLSLEIVHLQALGFAISDVVIEAKNFQAGLARDERLLDLQNQHGFRLSEHLTGWNKYDENIGVSSMATSFVKGEIEVPFAADGPTRLMAGELIRQLKAWKPLARGNKLRQDQVMALWFGWIVWRSRRKAIATEDATAAFKRALPPPIVARAQLILPIGVRV